MWALNVLTEESVRRMREDLPVEAAYVDTLVERVRDEVADQVRRLGGVIVAATVERGEPGEAVHKAGTDLESDLIVIGVRNRSRVGKLILGSATQEILLNAPCPVLSVPI
jgi:nucleotide-binding universal stress UspA family protein